VSWYREKPVLDFWVNIGYFVLTRRALNGLEGSATFQDALGNLAGRGELYAYRHHGLHITVNTRAELEDAESALSRWPSVG
jgi:glucose-1-phosphate cytidylyltransferase